MRLALSILIAAASATPVAAACPGSSPMSGVVLAVMGRPSAVQVMRGGEPMPVGVGLPICARDRISVNAGDTALRVKYFTGETRTYGTGMQEAPALGAATMLGREVSARMEVFSPRLQTYGRTMTGRNARPTPFALISPGVRDSSARLGLGWTGVFLRWRGGAGPFTVTLQPPDGATPMQVHGVTERGAHIGSGKLGLGTWRVTVADVLGREARGGFLVDPSAPPASPAAADEFAELTAAMTAMEMAGDRARGFEAEQVMAAAPEQGLDRRALYSAVACLAAPADDGECAATPGGPE